MYAPNSKDQKYMKQKQSHIKGERQIPTVDGELKMPLSVSYIMRKQKDYVQL